MSEHISASYSGIGFFAHISLHLVDSEEGSVVGGLDVGPEHLNRAGYVHGGVLCTMLDFAACAAGLHSQAGEHRRLAVTLSLSTQFTKAVDRGHLRVEGQLLSAGRKTYTAEARVYDDGGDLVAHAIGTFQWRPGSEPVATAFSNAHPEGN
jgi:uncharacterized protein (TIGR00369 family)